MTLRNMSSPIAELVDRWPEFGLETPSPERVRYLEIIGTTGLHGKATFLLWINNGPEPDLALKLLRDPQESGDLANEYQTLVRLGQLQGMAGAYPRPVYFGPIGGSIGLLEVALSGQKLAKLLREQHREGLQNTAGAVNWLIDFHQRTASELMLTKNYIDDLLIRPCADLMLHSDLTGAEQAYLQNICGAATKRTGQKMLKTMRHGDYWAGNILVDHAQIKVVDWEFSLPEWWPLYDLFYFCVQLMVVLDNVSIVEAFQQAFDVRSPHAAGVKQYLALYCERLQVNPSDVEMLFWSFLLTMANRERTSSSANAQRSFLNLSGYPTYNKKPLNDFLRHGIYVDAIKTIIASSEYMLWSEGR